MLSGWGEKDAPRVSEVPEWLLDREHLFCAREPPESMTAPTSDWQCDACGEVHTSNPEECTECGHSVLTPIRSKEQLAASETDYTGPTNSELLRANEWDDNSSEQTAESPGPQVAYIILGALALSIISFIVVSVL